MCVCVCVCGGGGGGGGVIIGLVSPYVFINVFNNYCDKYVARSGILVARSGVEVVSKWCRSGSHWAIAPFSNARL